MKKNENEVFKRQVRGQDRVGDASQDYRSLAINVFIIHSYTKEEFYWYKYTVYFLCNKTVNV